MLGGIVFGALGGIVFGALGGIVFEARGGELGGAPGGPDCTPLGGVGLLRPERGDSGGALGGAA